MIPGSLFPLWRRENFFPEKIVGQTERETLGKTSGRIKSQLIKILEILISFLSRTCRSKFGAPPRSPIEIIFERGDSSTHHSIHIVREGAQGLTPIASTYVIK